MRENVQRGSPLPHQEADLHRQDLARVWAELLAASPTDNKARQFVDYFREDARRLFGDADDRARS